MMTDGPQPAPPNPSPEVPGKESQANPALPPESTLSSVRPPRLKRAYKRRKKFRFTAARRAAVKANLTKAREALRERGWPHSEKQRAAARAAIKKAQAAVHKQGLPTTEARRAAMFENLAKANAALRERGYPRNEKQIAAARANLAKAHAESRLPQNYARYNQHKVLHGMKAAKLDAILRLCAELREEERARRRARRAAKRRSGMGA
jgi:hypothetical protein